VGEPQSWRKNPPLHFAAQMSWVQGCMHSLDLWVAHLFNQLAPAERETCCPEDGGGRRSQRLPQLAPADAQQSVALSPAAGAQHGGQRCGRQHCLKPLTLQETNRHWSGALSWLPSLPACHHTVSKPAAAKLMRDLDARHAPTHEHTS
jgi:hypothetical protein